MNIEPQPPKVTCLAEGGDLALSVCKQKMPLSVTTVESYTTCSACLAELHTRHEQARHDAEIAAKKLASKNGKAKAKSSK